MHFICIAFFKKVKDTLRGHESSRIIPQLKLTVEVQKNDKKSTKCKSWLK